jgi:hypothetical protein
MFFFNCFLSCSCIILSSYQNLLALKNNFLFLFFIACFLPSIVNAQTNMGTEFWTGFAFEQKMVQKTNPYPPYSGEGANMYVYISGTPGTMVTVEMPLLSLPFSQTVTIPLSGVVSVTGFPQGDVNDATNAAGLPDARLYYTGISNRAIHVYSQGAPISVWLYDYATNNSAGATLLLPTELWGNNYIVQAMGGLSNDPNPNSFFYVIAEKDSTQVNFIPSSDIGDSLMGALFFNSGYAASDIQYHANVPYTIILNKGQVFNAMGAINANGFGLDLSGTTISSLDPTKKIAVFGGNGRCLVSTPVSCPDPTAGSDNMVQQMMSTLYWDTEYFSVPTKSMAHNLYRIYVQDTATKIWINDTTHIPSDLISNQPASFGVTYDTTGKYWTYESSYPTKFDGDRPISITQFITSCSANPAIGNNGSGDPEMIILTSTQEAINSSTVYSPMIQDGSSGGAYINVIIPQAGVSTFNLDNLTTVDTGTSSFTGVVYGSAASIPVANAFKPYPADPNYYFATFHVGNGTTGAIHTMTSTVPFNSIVYGCAAGESYGFNAGCTLNHPHNVYTFTGNGNWSDTSKWSNNQLPPSDLPVGSEIVISGNCLLDILQTLEDGSTLTILTGANLNVNGNLLIQK